MFPRFEKKKTSNLSLTTAEDIKICIWWNKVTYIKLIKHGLLIPCLPFIAEVVWNQKIK